MFNNRNLIKLNVLNFIQKRQDLMMSGKMKSLKKLQSNVGWRFQEVFILYPDVSGGVQAVGGGDVLPEVLADTRQLPPDVLLIVANVFQIIPG